MHFLLEDKRASRSGQLDDLDLVILKNEIRKHPHIHTYENMPLELLQFAKTNNAEKYSYSVPVGSLSFVQEWLRKFKGIEKMNPIEIPQCLREPRCLRREYRIGTYEDIPRKGQYFVKRVDKLKGFVFIFYRNGEYSFIREK